MPRYVKRRYDRYWFQIAIPAHTQTTFGKKVIQENLHTSDVKVAAAIALERAAHWKRQFDLQAAEPHNLSEVYKLTLENTLQRIEWIRRKFTNEDDREFHLDLLQDGILEPELQRLGLADVSELSDELVSDEVNAAFAAVKAAREGLTEVPAEYREPTSETVKRFLAERQSDPRDRLTEQTISQMNAVFRLFANHLDDAPLATLNRQHATEFFDKVRGLSGNWGRMPGARTRSLSALLVDDRATAKPHLANRTLQRYASSLRQLWQWAELRGELEGSNPFINQVRRASGRNKSIANAPWDADAITAYLAAENEVGSKGSPEPHYWLPRMALLSGMRLDELCSLEVSDIKEAEGVRYFNIPKGKTTSSVRVVPMHSHLEELLQLLPPNGFIFPQLLPAGPDGKRSWNVGKRLRRRFGRIEGASTFHAFRKNVAQTFERKRIPETESSQILGHKRAGMTYGVYSPNGLLIEQKRDLIELLKLTA